MLVRAVNSRVVGLYSALIDILRKVSDYVQRAGETLFRIEHLQCKNYTNKRDRDTVNDSKRHWVGIRSPLT